MQQGESGRRPDRCPRTRDVEQRGRHTQVSTGLLEFPGETAEPQAVHFRTGGHRDGVGTEGLDRSRDIVEPAVYRYAYDLIAFSRAYHAGAYHRQPVVLVTLNRQRPDARCRCSRLRIVYLAARSSAVTLGRAMTRKPRDSSMLIANEK